VPGLEFHLFKDFSSAFKGSRFGTAVRLLKGWGGSKKGLKLRGLPGSPQNVSLSHGYDSELLGRVVSKKNLAYKSEMHKPDFTYPQSLVRPLIPLAFIAKPNVKIIDFGGGGGAQYFAASNLLSSIRKFSWRIIETPSVVKHSSSLAGEELGFYKSIAEAVRDGFLPDLVIASSSLEYTENPIESLQELINLEAEYFYITRSALTLGSKSIAAKQVSRLKHNGPGPLPDEFQDCVMHYRICVLPLKLVQQMLSKKYDILFTSLETEDAIKVGSQSVDHFGILAKLKETC